MDFAKNILASNWPEWQIVEQIGEGSYGKVFKIERNTLDIKQYEALKIIRISSNDKSSDITFSTEDRSFVNEIITEIKLMSELKGHTNIVSYEDHKVIEDADGKGWTILIRMELLTPLKKYLSDKDISDIDVKKIGIDISKALEVCQKQNILHRDIKISNVFVSKNGDFKLGDFGTARNIKETLATMTMIGTLQYMAPEVARQEAYGFSADIYSLGILLYQILNNGRFPFYPPEPQNITYEDVQNAHLKRMSGQKLFPPENASKEMTEIILTACEHDPKKRYGKASEMREALEKEPAIPPKVNWKKIVITVVCIIFVLGIGIGGFSAYKNYEQKKLEETFNAEITYSAGENMTIAEYETAFKEIPKRADLLFGENNYLIERNGTELKLKFSADYLKCSNAYIEIDPISQMLLHRPCELFVISYSEASSFLDNKGYDVISRESIVSAEAKLMSFEDVDYTKYDLTEGTPLNCVEFTLDKKTTNLVKSYIEKYGEEDVCFALDTKNHKLNTWYCFETQLDVENSVFRIITQWQNCMISENAVETLAYILSNHCIPYGVNFNATINYEPMWEKTDVSTYKGKNQFNELKEDYLELHFSLTSSDDNYKDRGFNHDLEMLKKRLDCLGEPYMVGFNQYNKEEIIVAIPPQKISREILSLLTFGHLDISTDFYDITSFSKYNYTIVENSDGTYSVEYTIDNESEYDTYNQKLSEATADFSKDNPGNIYIKTDSMKLLSCTVNEQISDGGKLIFNTIEIPQKQPITDEFAFVLDIMEFVEHNAFFEGTCSIDLQSTRIKRKDGKAEQIESDEVFGMRSENIKLEQTKNIISKIDPDIEVLFSSLSSLSNQTLYISLKLLKNENLPQKSVELVEKIYNECNLDDGYYDNIAFYLIEEEGNERCRIFFSKDTTNHHAMYCHAIFANGQIETYSNDFIKLLNGSDFYKSKLANYPFWDDPIATKI